MTRVSLIPKIVDGVWSGLVYLFIIVSQKNIRIILSEKSCEKVNGMIAWEIFFMSHRGHSSHNS